jgi:hypothetical protein
MTIAQLVSVALIKTGKILRDVFDAIVEAREQKTVMETQLYRNRYKHSSKFDDDLPVVH